MVTGRKLARTEKYWTALSGESWLPGTGTVKAMEDSGKKR